MHDSLERIDIACIVTADYLFDFLGAWRSSRSYQVKRAVDEFFAARGLPVNATYGEGRTATWLVEMLAVEG